MTGRKKSGKMMFLPRAIMLVLAAIGSVMVIRRLMVLAGIIPVSDRPGFASFDLGFGEHILIITLHIVPGAFFIITGLIHFMKRDRFKYIRYHRRTEWLFIIAAYLIALTSIVVPFIKQPIGGLNEAVATIFFGIIFLVCITKCLLSILSNQVFLCREWMIRTFSVGLAIATVRLITIFTYLSFKIPPEGFLGTAFWMGFSLHLLVAELWINYTRKSASVEYNNVLQGDQKQSVQQ